MCLGEEQDELWPEIRTNAEEKGTSTRVNIKEIRTVIRQITIPGARLTLLKIISQNEHLKWRFALALSAKPVPTTFLKWEMRARDNADFLAMACFVFFSVGL